MYSRIGSLALALVAVGLLSCQSGDQDPTPSGEGPSTAPTALRPGVDESPVAATVATDDFTTGDPRLDSIIRAVADADAATISQNVGTSRRGCANAWTDGPPTPPRCPDGAQPGTLVETVEFVDGETRFVALAEVGEALNPLLSVERDLCEVVRNGDSLVRWRSAQPVDDGYVVDDLTLIVGESGITRIVHAIELVPSLPAACP